MGEIVYGSVIADKMRTDLREKIIKNKDQVTLAVILVGNDPASLSYVRGKEKACAQVGIQAKTYTCDQNITERELQALIKKLNNDSDIDGILVQLPLPKHINSTKVIQSISVAKDVDGLTVENVGRLYCKEPTFVPCTPLGIMAILNFLPIKLAGKHAVVVGRSELVGAPISRLLLEANATVTMCHSYTKDLSFYTKQADILIVAVGKPQFINAQDVKKDAVVIDVGVNRQANGKLCGDVNLASVLDKVSYITPVPKGVGPMTITMLLWNTYEAHQRRMR